MKEDGHYYYLAVKSDLQKPLYTDLFISYQNELINIHASSQLGQRTLTGTEWTDAEPATRWRETMGWYANEVRFDRAKMRQLNEEGFEGNAFAETYFPYDGLEFQFDKKHWVLDNALLRLEVRNMLGPDGFTDVIFPSNTERKSTEKWHQLEFEN